MSEGYRDFQLLDERLETSLQALLVREWAPANMPQELAGPCTRILLTLVDGTPPFISLAAERSGVPRARAAHWIRTGEDPEREHAVYTPFARCVRMIRAEYMARYSSLLLRIGNQEAGAAKHAAWILTRLDRDLFDPPTSAGKDKPEKGRSEPRGGQEPTPGDLEDLGRPEPTPGLRPN